MNLAVLDSIDPKAFQAQNPFPWINPQHIIQEQRFKELLQNLPDIAHFRAFFGKQRKHGQASHNRYVLDYEEGMPLPAPWEQFITELRSEVYRNFVCILLGVKDVRFRLHWHWTPNGGEVSPHCDSKGKIGSHIFYLNSDNDWQEDWGGATVILDDKGRLPTRSAPSFDDFEIEHPAQTRNNHSLIFGRRGNSWHGVHRINCPENHYRKVFIVVFEEHRPLRTTIKRVQRLLKGKPMITEKEKQLY